MTGTGLALQSGDQGDSDKETVSDQEPFPRTWGPALISIQDHSACTPLRASSSGQGTAWELCPPPTSGGQGEMRGLQDGPEGRLVSAHEPWSHTESAVWEEEGLPGPDQTCHREWPPRRPRLPGGTPALPVPVGGPGALATFAAMASPEPGRLGGPLGIRWALPLLLAAPAHACFRTGVRAPGQTATTPPLCDPGQLTSLPEPQLPQLQNECRDTPC